MEKKKVLLCGGGNAVHVLSAYIGSLEEYEVNILSLFPGEAKRLQNAIPENGLQCINDLGSDRFGKPKTITDNPDIATNAEVVIFALPSFTHEMYLKAMKPFLKEGVTLGAMPGEGGFDLAVNYTLGNTFFKNSNVFALETLPWACRIVEYGKCVEVLGTKKMIDVVISPKTGNDAQPTLDTLQRLIGSSPSLKLASNFLAVTLMNINSVWHPTISYGFYRNKDVTKPFDEPPLFYQGADRFTGEKLAKVSDEVMEIGRVLREKYPGLDLSSLYHVSEWMTRSYGEDIGDKSNIYTMLHSNKGYRGLTHPMKRIETPAGEKYVPNFKYRYFTEDLPCGLIVTRGIAELAEVDTPHMDEVILWCQKMLGKEYIGLDGKLSGKDLDSTRCPQHYGFHDLDSFMRVSAYVQ